MHKTPSEFKGLRILLLKQKKKNSLKLLIMCNGNGFFEMQKIGALEKSFLFKWQNCPGPTKLPNGQFVFFKCGLILLICTLTNGQTNGFTNGGSDFYIIKNSRECFVKF